LLIVGGVHNKKKKKKVESFSTLLSTIADLTARIYAANRSVSSALEGSLTQDFRLKVFFMNQFSPGL
jgi:hypothetical protein